MPDEFADNHAVELEICMRWFSSDAGQVAKIEAPAGYANVRAHAMLHKSYVLKQQGALLQKPSAGGRGAEAVVIRLSNGHAIAVEHVELPKGSYARNQRTILRDPAYGRAVERAESRIGRTSGTRHSHAKRHGADNYDAATTPAGVANQIYNESAGLRPTDKIGNGAGSDFDLQQAREAMAYVIQNRAARKIRGSLGSSISGRRLIAVTLVNRLKSIRRAWSGSLSQLSTRVSIQTRLMAQSIFISTMEPTLSGAATRMRLLCLDRFGTSLVAET